MDIKILIEVMNEDAKKGRYFWVAGLARELGPALATHVDELHPDARTIVEGYLSDQDPDDCAVGG